MLGLSALALGYSVIRDWMTVFCYLVFVGGFQAILVLVVAVVLGAIKLFRSPFPSGRLSAGFVLFNVWLLFFGLVGDLVWEMTADQRLYINHDPVVEWIPFIIPGSWTIDPVCGGSLTEGTTWTEMYLVWLAIAVPVWTLTILSYRWTKGWLFEKMRSRSFVVASAALVALAVTLGVVAFFRMGFT